MIRSRPWLPVMLWVLSCGGCQWNRPGPGTEYDTVAPDLEGDTQAARQHGARGLKLLQSGDLAGAERELKKALAADPQFAAAHNNLGVIYYRQKKYYRAAWEFQYAAKLMPDKAQPRNNLGMVYEVAGKHDDAAKSYEEALKLDPEAVEIAANLARVYLRANRKDERARQLLRDVVSKDTRPAWVAWAGRRLALMQKPHPAAATQPAK